MIRHRWLEALHSLGLEFWLPLPLLGLFFWVGGGLMTDRILSHSYSTTDRLQGNAPLEVQRLTKVRAINVEINRRQGFSKVMVKTANSALKELKFEFPVTEFSQVEAAIGQELKLSPEQIRKLVRYQISPKRG